jgi:hypothetical protein
MDDIRSIIYSGLKITLCNSDAHATYVKNLDLFRAYKLAKLYVEFNDVKLYDILERFLEMRENIAQYSIMYKNDDILSTLCSREFIDLSSLNGIVKLVLIGDFPKTCLYMLNKKISLIHFHGWDGRLSKINTKLYRKHFHKITQSEQNIVFKNMILYGYDVAKISERFCFDKWQTIKPNFLNSKTRYLINQKIIKNILDFCPLENGYQLIENILRTKNLKIVKTTICRELIEKLIKNPSPRDLAGYIYRLIVDNENGLFIIESLNVTSEQYIEIAKQAICCEFYSVLNGMIIMKKIKTADKPQLLFEAIIDCDNTKIIQLLLSDTKINLDQLPTYLPNIRGVANIKTLFADPRINTPQNREIARARLGYIDH